MDFQCSAGFRQATCDSYGTCKRLLGWPSWRSSFRAQCSMLCGRFAVSPQPVFHLQESYPWSLVVVFCCGALPASYAQARQASAKTLCCAVKVVLHEAVVVRALLAEQEARSSTRQLCGAASVHAMLRAQRGALLLGRLPGALPEALRGVRAKVPSSKGLAMWLRVQGALHMR